MLASYAFKVADVHLFLVFELVEDASLDIEKKALFMIGDVALAGSDEVIVMTMTDGAFLAELCLDVKVDF